MLIGKSAGVMESLLISQVVANNFGALRETLQMLRGGRLTDNDDHGKELTLAWSDSHCDGLTALDLFTGSGAVTTGLESHNYQVLNIDFSSKVVTVNQNSCLMREHGISRCYQGTDSISYG